MTLTRDTIDILTIFIPYWDEDRKVAMPLSKLYEYYNTTSLNEIKKIMITVMNSAEWINEDGVEKFVPIIDSASFMEKDDYMNIYLTEHAQEEIKFIKSICDEERQKYLLSLSSTYSKRMYLYIQECCKTSIGNSKTKEFKEGYKSMVEESISQFKEYMGVSQIDGYNNFTNFNNRCLTPSICEVNEKTDVVVCYEPVQRQAGKKAYTDFVFHIKEKPEKEKKKLLKNISIRLSKRK